MAFPTLRGMKKRSLLGEGPVTFKGAELSDDDLKEYGISTGNQVNLRSDLPAELDEKISIIAQDNGLDEAVFRSVLQQESGIRHIDPKTGKPILSKAGAIGIGQLMPGTAADLGVDPYDEDQNLQGAAKYLKAQIDRFGLEDGLRAYNAGPGKVEKVNAGKDTYKRETQDYVPGVQSRLQGKEKTPDEDMATGAKQNRDDLWANFAKGGPGGETPDLTWGRAGGAIVEELKSGVRHRLKGLATHIQHMSEINGANDPRAFAPALFMYGPDFAEKRKIDRNSVMSQLSLVPRMTPEEAAKSPTLVEDLLTAAAWEAIQADPKFAVSSGWIEDQLRTLTQVGQQVLTGVATAGTAVMPDMYLMITGASYENFKQQNPDAPEEKIRAMAMANGLVQAPFEAIGLSKLTKFLKPKKAAHKMLKELSEIAGTEFVTEFLQSLGPDTFFEIMATAEPGESEMALLNEAYLTWEGLKENVGQAGKEGLHAALASVMFGGIAAGKRYKARKKLEKMGITEEQLADPSKMDPEVKSKVDELISGTRKATKLAKEKEDEAKKKGKSKETKGTKKFTLKKGSTGTGVKKHVMPAEVYDDLKAKGADMSGFIKAGSAEAQRLAKADAEIAAQSAETLIDIAEAETGKPVIDQSKQAWGNFFKQHGTMKLPEPKGPAATETGYDASKPDPTTQDNIAKTKVQVRFDKAKTVDHIKVDAVGAEGTTLPAGMVQVTSMDPALADPDNGHPPTWQVSISNAVKETKAKIAEMKAAIERKNTPQDTLTTSVTEAYMRAELKEAGIGTNDLDADQVEAKYNEENLQSNELAKLDALAEIVGLAERHPKALDYFKSLKQTDLTHPALMLMNGAVVPSSQRVPGVNFSKRTEADDIAIEEAYKDARATARANNEDPATAIRGWILPDGKWYSGGFVSVHSGLFKKAAEKKAGRPRKFQPAKSPTLKEEKDKKLKEMHATFGQNEAVDQRFAELTTRKNLDSILFSTRKSGNQLVHMYAPAEKGSRDELEGPLVENAFKFIHGKVSRGKTVDSNEFHTAMKNQLNDWVVTQESRASGNSKDYIKRHVAKGDYSPVIGSAIGSDILEEAIDTTGNMERGFDDTEKVRVLMDVGYDKTMQALRRAIYKLKRDDKKAAKALHGKGGRRTTDSEVLEIAQKWLTVEQMNDIIEGLDPFKLPGVIKEVDIEKHRKDMAKAKQRTVTYEPRPVEATPPDFRSAKQIIADLFFPEKMALIAEQDLSTAKGRKKAEQLAREIEVGIEKRHTAGYIMHPQALAKAKVYNKHVASEGILPRMYEDAETAMRAVDELNRTIPEKLPKPIIDMAYNVRRIGDKYYVAKRVYTPRKSDWFPGKQVDPHIDALLRDRYTMTETEAASQIENASRKKAAWLMDPINKEVEMWVKVDPLGTGIHWRKVKVKPDNANAISQREELDKFWLARHAAIADELRKATKKTQTPKRERGALGITPQSDKWMMDPAFVEFAWRNPVETTIHQPVQGDVKFLTELAKFKLPRNLMVITTSGSMVAQGVKDAKANNDIDVIVSPKLHEKLDALVKDKKLVQKPGKNGGMTWQTKDGHIEFIPAGQMHMNVPFEQVIKNSVRSKRSKTPFFFENLAAVRERKDKMGRAKDKADIKLIDTAMKGVPRPLEVGGGSKINDDLVRQMYTKAEMSQPVGYTKRVKDRKTKVFAERGTDARVIEEPGVIEVTVGDRTKAYLTLSVEGIRDLTVDIYENLDAAQVNSIQSMMAEEEARWKKYDEVKALSDAGKKISAADANMLENYETAKRNAAKLKNKKRDPIREEQHRVLLEGLELWKDSKDPAREARAMADVVGERKAEGPKPQPKVFKAMTPEERVAFLGKTEYGRTKLAEGRQKEIERMMGDARVKTEALTQETVDRLTELTKQAKEIRGKVGKVDVEKMPVGWHLFRFTPKYVKGDIRKGQTVKVMEYAGPTPEFIYLNLTGKRKAAVKADRFDEYIKKDNGKLSKLSKAPEERQAFKLTPEKEAELKSVVKDVKEVKAAPKPKKKAAEKKKEPRKGFAFKKAEPDKAIKDIQKQAAKDSKTKMNVTSAEIAASVFSDENIAKMEEAAKERGLDPVDVATEVAQKTEAITATPLVSDAPSSPIDSTTDAQKEAQMRVEEDIVERSNPDSPPSQGDVDQAVASILEGNEDIVNFHQETIKAVHVAYADEYIELPDGEIITPKLGSAEDMAVYEDAILRDDVDENDKQRMEEWMEEAEDMYVNIADKIADDITALTDDHGSGFNPFSNERGGGDPDLLDASKSPTLKGLKAMAKWMKGFGKIRKEGFHKTHAWADVAAGFKLGDQFAEETAFHSKNVYSFREAKLVQFERDVLTPFAEIIRKNFPNASADQMAQIVFAAEDTRVEAEMKRRAANMLRTGQTSENLYDKHFKEAVYYLRNFFTEARKWYGEKGMPVDFVANEIARQEARWAEAVDNATPETAAKAYKTAKHAMARIAKLQSISFIHLPSTFWSGTEIDKLLPSAKDKTFKAKRAALRAMLRKRRAVSIGDLVRKGMMKAEKVNPMEILMHYGSEMAYNESLFNIRDAAIKEGLIKIQKTKPKAKEDGPGWTTPLANMKGLIPFNELTVDENGKMVVGEKLEKGVKTYIRADAVQALDGALAADSPRNWWQSAMTGYKLLRFYNPLFLPMYDVFQSVGLAGAIGRHTPDSIVSAIRSITTKDKWYDSAAENGLFSKPFSPRIGDNIKKARAISTSPSKAMRGVQMTLGYVKFATEDVMNAIHDHKPGAAAWRASKAMVEPVMQMSWTVAWTLDNAIRLYTFHYLKNRGMSDRDAAQTAALAHGDYASIPAKTRRQLNNLFFTPTFKIAMAKAHAEMIKGTVQTMISPKEWGRAGKAGKKRAMARAMLGFIAINAGVDLLFKSLGWEEDEFGRKYTREVMTEDGLEEQVISFSTPLNLVWKFAKRFYDLVDPDPTEEYPMKKFIGSMFYEALPIAVTGKNIWNNRTMEGGQIFYHNDEFKKQYKDILQYAGGQVVPLIPKLGQMTGVGAKEPRRARMSKELLQEDWGKFGELMSRFFVFHYLRSHPDVRLKRDLQGLEQRFTREVNEKLIEDGEFDDKWYDTFYDRQEQALEEYFKEQ